MILAWAFSLVTLRLFYPQPSISIPWRCRGCTKNFLVDTSLYFIVLNSQWFLNFQHLAKAAYYVAVWNPWITNSKYIPTSLQASFFQCCVCCLSDWLILLPRKKEQDMILAWAFSLVTLRPFYPQPSISIPRRCLEPCCCCRTDQQWFFSHGQLFFLFGLFKRQLLEPFNV
jgi:hypothetical protein